MNTPDRRPALSIRAHFLFALAAGAVAGVIYSVIWAIVDRGSILRLLVTALITFAVAFALRTFFEWLFTRRRGG